MATSRSAYFEVTAVCQCAGNRRGLFQPHVPGVQWGYGAMGCTKWKGARLKDLLDLVGLNTDAVEVVFDGADGPILDNTPDFLKSIPVWKALEETTLVAYEMNDEALPHWNGFPARIVVPGWAATYWVKHVTKIAAVTKPFDGFWMKTAYRIPLGKFPLVRASYRRKQPPTRRSRKWSRIRLSQARRMAPASRPERTALSGIAWDGGYGISAVETSADGGKSWTKAALGEDLGKYAFRAWIQELMS
jgi:DMSO/TMAO reductase YedYZ molybdopterin-dependent catalytic subunit